MQYLKFQGVLLLLLAAFFHTNAQQSKPLKTDKKLTKKLGKAISGFHGDVGVYVKNLKTGKGAAIHADTVFPTASTIKVPIMCALFDKIMKDELSYHQPLLYRDSIAYGGSGVMQYFKDSTKTNLSVPATLMITRSDNTAALWCQSLAGGGTVINQWLDNNGFKHTRVNSRTPGREKIWEVYGWGQTTPREIAQMLVDIYQQNFLTPAICERMHRNMIYNYWDSNALSQIPPYVQTISKSGAVADARSEVVLVTLPVGKADAKNAYVFAIYTKNNKDQSWTSGNEAAQLIRKVSALLWHYYAPKSNWEPAEGIEEFWGDE